MVRNREGQVEFATALRIGIAAKHRAITRLGNSLRRDETKSSNRAIRYLLGTSCPPIGHEIDLARKVAVHAPERIDVGRPEALAHSAASDEVRVPDDEVCLRPDLPPRIGSEEHKSELQSLMRISYA